MKIIDRYHKWVEWRREDGVYIGKCPALIAEIHGDDLVRLYSELCEAVEYVILHFEQEGRILPYPRVGPMREFCG